MFFLLLLLLLLFEIFHSSVTTSLTSMVVTIFLILFDGKRNLNKESLKSYLVHFEGREKRNQNPCDFKKRKHKRGSDSKEMNDKN